MAKVVVRPPLLQWYQLYATKQCSISHKIRLMTNSSSNHPNGSLNSHVPKGINLIGSLKSVFTKFRLKFFAVIFDLARAYRSLYSTDETNRLRLMWWVVDPEKATADLDDAMRIFMLKRVTYGDVGASTQLELAIRKIIAPECKTTLGRDILAGDRYVDDVLSSHDDVNLLLLALDDIEETLKNHGFTIKRIISNGLWFHKEKNLLKDKNTSTDGAFTADEVSETTFGHQYNWQCWQYKLSSHS